MPDGEVKIHVSADADLKKIEDAQKKIADLRRAADAYESKGIDTAAKSARSDANGLERDVARWTKDRARDEKLVTRELNEQHALKKAGVSVSGRRVAQAVGVGEQVLAGGNPTGSASSLLVNAGMSSGNPAIIAASIAAALATGLAGLLAKEQDKDTAQSLKFDERRAGDDFRRNKNWGVFGGSAALMGESLEAKEEAARRSAATPGLQEKARQKWYDPSTWEWGGLRKNEGTRDLEENERERMAASTREASAKRQAQARYEQTDGGLELDELRNRAKRSQAGQRGAFVAQEAKKAFSKYEEARRQGASDDMAKEIAELTYKNDLRDRQASAGAGLVDARTGAGGIAAAARWATQGTPSEQEIGGKLETLISVVNQGNQAANTEKLHK